MSVSFFTKYHLRDSQKQLTSTSFITSILIADLLHSVSFTSNHRFYEEVEVKCEQIFLFYVQLQPYYNISKHVAQFVFISPCQHCTSGNVYPT